MTIHREGRTILFILLIALVGLNYLVDLFTDSEMFLNIVIGASVVLYLLVLQFFRSPEIETPQDPAKIYAPADGKVVVVENANEQEYLKEDRIQISIFMSPLNVHVNRAPVSGKVSYFKYHPGKYLVAWHPKSSTENERTTLVIKVRENLEILVRQVAGAVARRIKCYVNEGSVVEQGEEFGFIRFGSRLDVYIPVNAVLKIKIGDKTTAGKTVLAELMDQIP